MARATERRQHSDAFKRKVVAAMMRGKKAPDIAAHYELSPSMVRTWFTSGRWKPVGGRSLTLDELPEEPGNSGTQTKRRSSVWRFCPNCGEKLR